MLRRHPAAGGEGITVLLIEQNMGKSLDIADRAYILESGRVVLEGHRDKLVGEGLIERAYLGH